MASPHAPSSSPGPAAGSTDSVPSWSARAGDATTRAIVVITGVGLLIGFFLPWIRFADVAAVSGLSLLVSSGTVVEALAGPSRGLLILIPVCGAALIACGIFGPRLAALAALASGLAIIGFGLFTLARVFVATVGTGMWVVVVSALAATATGLAALLRSRSSG